MKFVIGDHYNWKGQPDLLVYRGKKGTWYQFSRYDHPDIWCEVLEEDLHMLEESPDFYSSVLKQLPHIVDGEDQNHICNMIAQFHREGWKISEVVEYLHCTEEITPSLDEDTALSQMSDICDRVKRRLTQPQKVEHTRKLTEKETELMERALIKSGKFVDEVPQSVEEFINQKCVPLTGPKTGAVLMHGIKLDDLRALMAGKALVPVDLLRTISKEAIMDAEVQEAVDLILAAS